MGTGMDLDPMLIHVEVNTGGKVQFGCTSLPSRAACTSDHTFCGVSGISILVMPSGASASNTALTIAGGAAIQPASPTPLAPSGLEGEGVSMVSVTNAGTCSAEGKA